MPGEGRRLATVLLLDVVRSTQIADELGDSDWHRLLEYRCSRQFGPSGGITAGTRSTSPFDRIALAREADVS